MGGGLGQLPDESRSIGTGRQLGRELLDLAFRAVGGPLQDGLPVVGGQVRGELGNGGEVEPRSSASMVRRTGCSRDARAAAMRR